MKGIILAGGSGSRLGPITSAISKHLVPVYDKPLIYYPISTMMLAGINDILVIVNQRDLPTYKSLLGDGSSWGIAIQYAVQDFPGGIAESILIGESFIESESFCLVLGDNIFYGAGLGQALESTFTDSGALVFIQPVNDPERFGVIELDPLVKILSLEEKPEKAKSNLAITGMYFFDNQAISFAKNLVRSPRGELEIIDILQAYMQRGHLATQILPRGTVWLDAGTVNSLTDASEFIRVIQNRYGIRISVPEEIAYRKGFIDKKKLLEVALPLKNSDYGRYLESVALN